MVLGPSAEYKAAIYKCQNNSTPSWPKIPNRYIFLFELFNNLYFIHIISHECYVMIWLRKLLIRVYSLSQHLINHNLHGFTIQNDSLGNVDTFLLLLFLLHLFFLAFCYLFPIHPINSRGIFTVMLWCTHWIILWLRAANYVLA